MTYTKQTVAQEAMAAWADISTAPALAVVRSDGTYRIAETDKDGVLVIRSDEDVIETMWTQHSAGIARITEMNAYSVGCCYKLAYVNVQKFQVPHGINDLSPFLDQAIMNAKEKTNEEAERFRSCDHWGDVFIDAIYEDGDNCPRSDGLPVPDNYSEAGSSNKSKG